LRKQRELRARIGSVPQPGARRNGGMPMAVIGTNLNEE
jgi:hypothetical protein